MIHYLNELSLSEKLREAMQDSGEDFPFSAIESNLAEYVNNCASWHWHEYMEFAWVVSGDVECRMQDDTFVLRPGEGYFVNANVLHLNRMASGSARAVLRVVQFETRLIAGSGGIVQRYVRPIEQCSDFPALALTRDDPRQRTILDAAAAAFDAAAEEGRGYEMTILRHILRAWQALFDIAAPRLSRDQRMTDGASERIKAMLGFIHTHCGEEIAVGDVAAAASISEREAFRTFRQVLNTTPTLYLARHRVSVAARMLRESDLPVTEVALACGFSNPSYFCKVFRRLTGQSPRDFRRATTG